MKLYHPKIAALLWLLGLLLTGWLGFNTLQRNWLETGFLALLPTTEQQPAVLNAIERNNQAINRKVLCLSGAATSQQAIALAEQLKQQFHDSGLFGQLVLQQPQQAYQQRYQRLFPYRYQLLDEATRHTLQTRPQQLSRDNLAMLYSPVGQLQAANLEHDPLLLFSRYFGSQNPLPLTIEQGVVVVQDGEKFWALLIGELQDSDLKLDKLERLLALVESNRQHISTQGGELLATGMPLFTAHGSQTAQQEMSLIGSGSTLGVVVLLVLAFRSVRPLLLSCLAVACGLFAAWVWSLQLFDKLHMLTLVFGASLIGVVVDYALHFFCDGIGLPHWTPRSGLRYVLPGIAFGLFTSLLGYAGLGFSPFPVLQQIAVFSAIGLTVSWLTVVGLFPALLQGFQPQAQPRTDNIIRYWQRHWPDWLRQHKRAASVFLLVLIGGGLAQLTAHDDIRLLQSAPADLRRDDARIRQLLPLAPDNQFFLVSGKDEVEWYQNERRLLADLDALQQTGVIKRFDAISRNWPNADQQAVDYQLLKTTVYRREALQQTMGELGFSAAAISEELAQFAAAERRVLLLSDWLTIADERQQRLWLGCEGGECRSIVALSGIRDIEPLAALQNRRGVAWVDQVGQVSEVFHRYRLNVSLLLVGVCGVILALLTKQLGWRSGLQVMAVPVLAIAAALAVLGWFGELFTLFNVFALLLVLEMSVDYAIFFHIAEQHEDAADKRNSTALAVTLSALTTLLAYGLLAASSTAIIHAFGVTLAAGVLTAFLLAPLV